jgi:hypothetical protein
MQSESSGHIHGVVNRNRGSIGTGKKEDLVKVRYCSGFKYQHTITLYVAKRSNLRKYILSMNSCFYVLMMNLGFVLSILILKFCLKVYMSFLLTLSCQMLSPIIFKSQIKFNGFCGSLDLFADQVSLL